MATPQAERKKDLAYQKRVEERLKQILSDLAALEKLVKEASNSAKTTKK